jgi:hypothetical protein
MATGTSALPASLLDVLRQGTLTEEQAWMIDEQGPEAVLLADESGWRVAADAIRLRRARADLPEQTYASRRARPTTRLQELLATPWKDRHAKRLIKRLRRHQNDLLGPTRRSFRPQHGRAGYSAGSDHP